MKKQLTHISLHQSAKVVAALYFVVLAPLAVIWVLAAFVGGGYGIFAIFGLLAPILYAALGYVMVVIFAWVYNLVAKRVGGIEVTVTEVPGV